MGTYQELDVATHLFGTSLLNMSEQELNILPHPGTKLLHVLTWRPYAALKFSKGGFTNHVIRNLYFRLPGQLVKIIKAASSGDFMNYNVDRYGL